MVVIILMCPAVSRFHLIHRNQFWQNEIEQTCIFQVIETAAWVLGEHNLVHLVADSLSTDNLQALGIAGERIISLLLYLEIELGSETHATHHTQRVIRKSDIRVERCGNNTIFHIVDTIKRIYEFSKTVFVQTDSHRIDSEVAAVLVILQRSIFHNRFSGIAMIALLTGANKLHFSILILHLCSSEITEHREMRLSSEHLLQGRSYLYTATNHNDINIIGRSLQEEVTHISTYYITLHRQPICCL